MIEIFYDFLMLPLKTVIQAVYDGIQVIVHNKGSALFVLSIVTVMIMLPIEQTVRSVVAREKLIEAILSPQITRIRSSFKGRERNDAIKRLYQRYSYNPLSSIKSTLGILVQIPFLLAAYWMLSDYSALQNYHYSFIDDLSQPDRLLFGINLLPILMTVVNIATTAISRFQKKEAIQATFIALFFLVLLYDAPSALLLYWTTNNVIHFLRALLKRLKEEKGILKDKIYKKFHVNFIFQLNITKKTEFQILIIAVLILIFKILEQITHKSEWTIATYLTTALVLVLLSIFLFKKSQKAQGKAIILTFNYLVLAFSFFTVVRIISYGCFDGTKHHLGQWCFISVLFLLISLYGNCLKEIAISYFKKIFKKSSKNPWTMLGIKSVIVIFICCVVVSPLRFYSQNLTELQFTGESLAGYIAICTIPFLLITYFISQHIYIPKYIALILLVFSTCIVFQNFIWPQQVKEFIGYDYNWFSSSLSWINALIWLLFMIGGMYLCAKYKILRQTVLMFNYSILVVISIITWSDGLQKIKESANQESLTFMQDGMFDLGKENIIVFLLDTVSAESMTDLWNTDKKELNDIFKGFTWYKNNVGSGFQTSFAIPYLFTNTFMQKGEGYLDYLNRAYSKDNFFDFAKMNGWNARVYSDGKLFPGKISNMISNSKPTRSFGLGSIEFEDMSDIRKLVIYNSSPDLCKGKTSGLSELFQRKTSHEENNKIYKAFNDPGFYQYYKVHPFKTVNNNKNFIFYHLRGTHPPYNIDINGKWIMPGSPYTSEQNVLLGCLRQINFMLNGLKKVKKFNDSTIVILSDHGKHKLVKESYPILLVKRQGENNSDDLKFSYEPTGHKNLFVNILSNQDLSVGKRQVLDYAFDIYEAPDEYLQLNNNNFIKKENMVAENLNYKLTGFEPEQAFGAYMSSNAQISFKDTKRKIIKLEFNQKSHICNGYMIFSDSLGDKRLFVGENGTVIFPTMGPSLDIRPECSLDKNDKQVVYFLKSAKFGLFDIVTPNKITNEFYCPQRDKSIVPNYNDGSDLLVSNGFSYIQPNGIWTQGKQSIIQFRTVSDIHRLQVKVKPNISSNIPCQRIILCTDNGSEIKTFKISKEEEISIDLEPFKTQFENIDITKIVFKLPDAFVPNNESRELSLFLNNLRFE